MEIIEVDSLKAGDRLVWIYPNYPIEQYGIIVKIVRYATSKNYGMMPYVDFFSKEPMGNISRSVGLPYIIKKNGRRVDRESWNKRMPVLGLFRPNSRATIEEVQIQLLFDEEEDLATLKTTTRKGLDEMSESHRAHIEKWEDHISSMGIEHVWASANRFAGRGGEGSVFVAGKRGAKDYVILDYNTETKKKPKVLADGFESSKTLIEAFKEYREQAKEERAESKPSKPKATKADANGKVAKKTVMKKAAKGKKIARKK